VQPNDDHPPSLIARTVWAGVCLWPLLADADAATLEIHDDGRGGQSSGSGSGLRGLRGQLVAAGCALSAGAAPSDGFALVATLPGGSA
jgi:hypothetical protein